MNLPSIQRSSVTQQKLSAVLPMSVALQAPANLKLGEETCPF
jgi:hypothetical protein